jgi:hypothetical protein
LGYSCPRKIIKSFLAPQDSPRVFRNVILLCCVIMYIGSQICS